MDWFKIIIAAAGAIFSFLGRILLRDPEKEALKDAKQAETVFAAPQQPLADVLRDIDKHAE